MEHCLSFRGSYDERKRMCESFGSAVFAEPKSTVCGVETACLILNVNIAG